MHIHKCFEGICHLGIYNQLSQPLMQTNKRASLTPNTPTHMDSVRLPSLDDSFHPLTNL